MRIWTKAAAAAAVVLAACTVGGGAAAVPTAVTLAGDLDTEIGCASDWQQDCTVAHMTLRSDGVYALTASLPAGDYQYKVALNDSWDENYGAGAQRNGANISLHVAGAGSVTFYYDPTTHYVTDTVSTRLVTAPGNYQHTVAGCSDWQADCVGTWLEDPDGDGTYTYSTTSIPKGSYEFKIAVGLTWDENYGVGGAPGGANIQFTVPDNGMRTTFTWSSATKLASVAFTRVSGHGQDDNVEWNGLGFDSRETLYKVPQGAVPAGTPVTLRFRTFHNDVTSVRVRLWDVHADAQRLVPMTRAAQDVSCYSPALANDTCDYWQATIASPGADVYWYRFIVQDGSSTAYYGDDTAALDGGAGATTTNAVDQSWSETFFDPSFAVPAWASHAIVYQIFPDRFANGDRKNDPKTTDALYDTHPTLKDWNAKPEGYCRSYDTPCSEGPHGTDYDGGDLKGIRQKLEWIRLNGFDTIYLNPIFWAKSNHRYDTADYLKVDPYLGDMKEFTLLVKQAHELGMHIILDGVFNHMSSDSPFFDRYHHATTVGACESTSSLYHDWFTFTGGDGPCADGNYNGWFGFDSIPVLTKSLPAVQSYFLTGDDSVAKHWLRAGSDGWRLDVMGDPSFPAGYWETFRRVVKQTDPNALIVGELWQKDSTLLRLLDGTAADSTMNYRLRDAVLGLLAPQSFDPKGFGDAGHQLTPTQFAARLAAQQEDYAPQAYGSLLNLLDSHDTARLLWDLTPGAPDTAAKELNAANVAAGKARQRIAALIQYTLPGMPTVYYGDEVGMTGADDPDDRRAYPWPDTGGKQDLAMLTYYRALALLRTTQPELVDGDFRVLLADDAAGTVAYGREGSSRVALVAINRSGSQRTLTVPVAGYVPDGTQLVRVGGNGVGVATVAGGTVSVTLPAVSAAVLGSGPIDLTPPAAPDGLAAAATGGAASLRWNAVDGAASYALYRSPVSGGGYVRIWTGTDTHAADTGLRNGQRVYYVVRALDSAGNESGDSNEAVALPHLTIGWANLQWPPHTTWTLSTVTRTESIYGQVYIEGATEAPGPADTLSAELGVGPHGSMPGASWTWVAAGFNTQSGNNDEYVASLQPAAAGQYDYAYRYSTDGGDTWLYGELDGPHAVYDQAQAGQLTVEPPADTTPPAAPSDVHVVAASPSAIEIGWTAPADPDVAGYDIARSTVSGGPYALVGSSTSTDFLDLDVTEGSTYSYVVRAFDASANRSAASPEISATTARRLVHVVFTVTVPAATDGTGRAVDIAGELTKLGAQNDWAPGQNPLTRLDAAHWTVGFDALEGTTVQYKYALNDGNNDWTYVEKNGACGEIANRQITLAYGTNGTDTESDTVENWRNVPPCGN